MKKILITLLALACALTLCAALSITALALDTTPDVEPASSVNAPADTVISGTAGDNVSWTLNKRTGRLDVTGTGEMSFSEYYGIPWDSYRYDIRTVYIGDGITSIPQGSFSACPFLYAVTVGSGVKSIGLTAFSGAEALLEVYNRSSLNINANAVDDGNFGYLGHWADYVYTDTSGESKLVTVNDFVFYINESTGKYLLVQYLGTDSSITLPSLNSVSSYNIHRGAFYNRRDLKEITISTNVGTLYYGAFYRCTGLTELYLPDSLVGIDTSAFRDCPNLTHLRLGTGLSYIQDDAFSYCNSLIEICNDSDLNITAGSTDFGGVAANARYVYPSLNSTSKLSEQDGFIIYTHGDRKTLVKYAGDSKDVVIPNGIYEIAAYAFSGSDITSVVIPSSVERMQQKAFYYCNELTDVTLPFVGKTRITRDRFVNIFDNCANVKKVTLTEGDRIPEYAFAYVQSLEEIKFPEGLTTIEKYAFEYCTSLKEIVIPDTVTSIGDAILEGCTSLESVTAPFFAVRPENASSLGYFFGRIGQDIVSYNHRTLRHVTITQATKIEDRGFKNWQSLVSITLPKTLTEIGESAFSGCYALSEIYNLSSLDITVGSDTHGGVALNAVAVHTSLDDPSAVIWVDDFALTKDEQGKYTLVKYSGTDTVVEVPSAIGEDQYSIVTIAPYAFSYNSKVTKITLPHGVEVIGAYAFYKCSSLTKLEIPSTIMSMKQSAVTSAPLEYSVFEGVKYLGNSSQPYLVAYGPENSATFTSYTAHEQTKIIFDHAFAGNNNLESITLTDNITEIGVAAFGSYYVKEVTVPAWVMDHLIVTSLEKATIISGERLPSYAFSNATKLKTVILHDRLEVIGDNAFHNCSSLESITLPDNVCKIEASAFEKCTSLKSIKLPYFVNSIPLNCFKDCTSLETVDFNSDDICIMLSDKGAFENCTALKKVIVESDIAWLGIEFIDEYSNPTYYAKSLYVNGELLTELYVSHGKVGKHQFVNNEALKSVSIPYEDVVIESGAFAGCMGIEVAELPADKFNFIYKGKLKTAIVSCGTEIPNSTFNGCTALEYVTLPEGLTRIGKSAFSSCPSIKSINIPASVTSIDEYAFSGSLVERVIINDIAAWCAISFGNHLSNPAAYGSLYLNDEPLEYVDIPETVTQISSYAFYYCSSVKTIVIRSENVDIGEYAFYGTTPTRLVICADLIPAFTDCNGTVTHVEITGGTTIPEGAFSLCEYLTSVTLPETLSKIEKNAFEGCSSLKTIGLPQSLTYLGERAFAGCSSLEGIYIPEGVTKIHEQTFLACSSLATVGWHGGIVSIGDAAFSGCSSLESISFCQGLQTIGDYAFSGCKSITSLTFPASVKKIGNYAFDNCGDKVTYIAFENPNVYVSDSAFQTFTSIEWAKLPASAIGLVPLHKAKIVEVTGGDVLPDSAFYGHKNLTSVTLPSTLKEIGSSAFSGCSSLESINIPDGVRSIAHNAFSDCGGLLVSYSTIEGWLAIDFANGAANPLNNGGTLYIGGSTAFNIPDGTTVIKEYSFFGMNNTISINIPSSITEIGYDAFYNARNLQSVVISDLDAWCKITFNGICSNPLVYAGNLYIGEDMPLHIEIPSTVTELLPYVFAGVTSVETMTIPKETVTFNYSMFEECRGLKSILYCGEDVTRLTYKVSFGGQTTIEHHRYQYQADTLTHVMVCSVCQARTEDYYHDYDQLITINPATHTEKGDATYSCVCGKQTNVELEIIPHSFYTVIEHVDATHTAEGYDKYECECGETVVYTIEKLAEHTYDSGTVTTPATHISEGVLTYSCLCGESYTESIPSLYEHEWDEGTVTAEPSHTKYGAVAYTCTCGLVEYVSLDPTPEHEWGEWCYESPDNHICFCECGETMIETHSYDDDGDIECNICEYTRELDSTEAETSVIETTSPSNETESEPSDKIEPDEPDEPQNGGSSYGCGAVMDGGAVMALLISLSLAIPFARKKKHH